MKLASVTLCFTLASTLFAADAPKPAAPETKGAAKEKTEPPIITLEGPRLPILPKIADPAVAAPADPSPNAQSGGPLTPKPVVPPGLRLGPATTENAPAIPLNDANPTPIPGIYLSSPYTGIVVVPPPMDEGILKPAPPTRDAMPQATPELRLTPKK